MGQNILKLIKPADVITLINALLGFASIIMTVWGQFDSALVLILIAVIADGADGAVARYFGFGVLGANLDSLADVIAFGVAPALLAFVFLVHTGYIAGVFSGFFLACGILRLARFNVAGKKDGFEGIPITAGGFVVALFLLIRDYVGYFDYVFILLLVILSLLMISNIDYPKLKKPVILAPMSIVLVFDIAVFYMGYSVLVKEASLLLFIMIFAYILSPIGRSFYARSK
ncbi:MAG: CDP-diacylglycerol--serine O-phosphatidyltransferase [Candidatus Methanoperedens sp.]|nr:CDP-diacylglycerol--serine O-phosphatidyltransferase [Candidatus Methanoperedens sp.]